MKAPNASAPPEAIPSSLRRLPVELGADQPTRDASEVTRLCRPENLYEPRQSRADVLHCIVALGLREPLGRPALGGQLRRSGGIERRRQFAGPELQPLFRRKLAIVLDEIARKPMLAVGRLRRAYETEPRIAERHPVLRIPPVEKRARHLARHTANAGPRIDPARRHEIHPRLAVALAHELDSDPADAVGEIVVRRACDRIRHAAQAELVEARQEFLMMLVPENAKHPLGRIARAPARHQRQNQAGEIRVVQPRRRLQRPRICFRGRSAVNARHARSNLRASPDARGPADCGRRGRS